MDPNSSVRQAAQIREPPLNYLWLEREFIIGMRSRDDIRRAGVSGNGQHSNALLQGLRAIVHSRQDMAMNVDQIFL